MDSYNKIKSSVLNPDDLWCCSTTTTILSHMQQGFFTFLKFLFKPYHQLNVLSPSLYTVIIFCLHFSLFLWSLLLILPTMKFTYGEIPYPRLLVLIKKHTDYYQCFLNRNLNHLIWNNWLTYILNITNFKIEILRLKVSFKLI